MDNKNHKIAIKTISKIFIIVISLIISIGTVPNNNDGITNIKNHYLHRWLILLYQTNLYILKKHFYLMLI